MKIMLNQDEFELIRHVVGLEPRCKVIYANQSTALAASVATFEVPANVLTHAMIEYGGVGHT
jgi:hypothetical protein